uniref:Uncharacterized protein n=1 Tax=Brassica oleracea var. oleracea TaxID=109376 RepID=A0A0D3AJQ0_BRAOL
MEDRESKQGTYTKLAKQGSDRAVTNRRSGQIPLEPSMDVVLAISKASDFTSDKIYGEFSRVLKPGGSVIVCTSSEGENCGTATGFLSVGVGTCIHVFSLTLFHSVKLRLTEDQIENPQSSCGSLCTLLNIGLCSNSSRLKFQVLCCVATKPAVESVQCFGRKKTAVAVTHCKHGCGLIKLNGCTIELFQPEILRFKIFEPVLLLGKHRFAGVDMRIRVNGGGHTSQVYAIRQS